MAKRIKNPIILHVKYELDGEPHIESATCDYGIECDDGLEMRNYLNPTGSPTQINDLMDILSEVLIPQIKTKEGIS